jgi:hypothetical protein
MILRHINGVQRRKAFFHEFSRSRLSSAFNELLIDLKNDLVVGQLPLLSFCLLTVNKLPLLSFCLLTVNKSARQIFKLFPFVLLISLHHTMEYSCAISLYSSSPHQEVKI